MSRVALLSSEPIRPTMGGIGIRYLELARRLPAAGFDVLLISPATPEESARCGLDAASVRRFDRESLPELVTGAAAAVAQGQLANDLLLARPDLPTAIDLYDPWLIENLHYLESLGLDPYRNDHATWVLQLSRGDFFLCSSREQRLFYAGFLTALGRVNPERARLDPTLSGLIAEVPFGLPDELPEHRPWLGARRPGERRLLFGGLYDWYDPWTTLDAIERLEAAEVRLYVIRNPNPESTPQRLFGELERRLASRPRLRERVVALDWVPAERRFDLLREVDLMVSPHRAGLESDLALRTRFLEALAAGCPVVASDGGTIARLLREHGAGWVVPPEDPEALAEALRDVLAGSEVEPRRAAGWRLAEAHRWPRVLAPLVDFLAAPRVDATKSRFAFRPATVSPPDGLGFRLRRALARTLGARG